MDVNETHTYRWYTTSPVLCVQNFDALAYALVFSPTLLIITYNHIRNKEALTSIIAKEACLNLQLHLANLVL